MLRGVDFMKTESREYRMKRTRGENSQRISSTDEFSAFWKVVSDSWNLRRLHIEKVIFTALQRPFGYPEIQIVVHILWYLCWIIGHWFAGISCCEEVISNRAEIITQITENLSATILIIDYLFFK